MCSFLIWIQKGAPDGLTVIYCNTVTVYHTTETSSKGLKKH